MGSLQNAHINNLLKSNTMNTEEKSSGNACRIDEEFAGKPMTTSPLESLIHNTVETLMAEFSVNERIEFVQGVVFSIRDKMEGIRNVSHANYESSEDNLQTFIKAVGDPFGYNIPKTQQ
jgi:hypothetical protein